MKLFLEVLTATPALAEEWKGGGGVVWGREWEACRGSPQKVRKPVLPGFFLLLFNRPQALSILSLQYLRKGVNNNVTIGVEP